MESKRISVLAIDDNTDNLITIEAILSDSIKDILIYTANSGIAGIDMARKYNPDVILLDIIMPEMDGFEVCKILKDDEFLTEIPVVFLTALKGDKDTRIKGLEAGAEAFLSKPIDESELIAQIKAMAKIKSINILKRDENERLAALVAERTKELERTHIATLNLLEDLQKENEVRKKAEKALSLSESLYRSIIQASPDNTTVTDIAGNIIMISPSGLKLLEATSQDELIGENIFNLLSPDFHEGKANHLSKILTGKKVGPDEYIIISKKGKNIDVEINAEAIVNENGEKNGFVFIIRDITERKIQERKLKESEELYKAILVSSPDSIIITDIKGNVVMASPAAYKAFGVSTKDNIKGINIGEYIAESDKEKMLSDFGKMVNGTQTGPNEYKSINKKGKISDIEVKGGYIYDIQGGIANLVFLARDITERNIVNKRIQHISRLYAFLGQMNQTVVRVLEEDELLSKVCEIAVKYGEFKTAWIGSIKNNEIIPTYHYGVSPEFLQQLTKDYKYSLNCSCPVGKSIKTESPVFCNDIINYSDELPCLEKILEEGCNSIVAIPICKNNQTIGVLNLYSKEKGFFDEDEKTLLLEIAEDISFALGNIEANNIRKQIEENLIESENRYNTFINNNSDLIFVKDEKLRYIIANDAVANFYGRPKAEIINKTDLDLTSEGYISPCVKSDTTVLSQDHVMVFYEELGDRVFETTKFRMKLKNGEYGIGGIMHDITNRRKSEIALEESRLELKAIYDNAPVMLCVVDEEFKVLYQNNEFETFLHKSNSEIIGDIIGNVVGCIEACEAELGCGNGKNCKDCNLRSALKQTLTSGTSQQDIEYHTTIVAQGKQTEIYLLGSTALINTAGQRKILLCLFDITNRKNAEKALAESEMILRTFIENAPFGIWARDIDGVGILENKLLSESFGSIIGKTIETDTKISADKKTELHKINNKAYAGKIVETELYHTINGEAKTFHNIAFPIFLNNAVMGIAGFDMDITQRKNTENALKESQEQLKNFAAHLQKVREEERNLLAREIHDDLGQILVGLKIDIGFLKMKLSDYLASGTTALEAELVKLLDLVNKTIKTARRIMSDLRPEALEELGIVDAMKNHVAAFQERFDTLAIFTSDFETIHLDNDKGVALFRILQESLNNIAKHAKASRVNVHFGQQGNIIFLEIKDNGVGFDVSKKSRIDSYGLLGMKERAYLLEAELKIHSEIDKGTFIRIEIPLAQ